MAFVRKDKEQEAHQRYQVLQGNSMDRYSRNSGVYAEKKAAILAEYSRNNSANYTHKRAKKGSLGKKIAIAVLSLLFVGVLGAGTAFALFVNGIAEGLSGTYTEQEKFQIQEALVESNINEPFYMMLIGGDARDDLNGRTDTNILTRVDPNTRTVTMISIPRDTKINHKGSTMKFNAAFVYDGVAGTISAASDLCHVDISHYAFVDFYGFVDLVTAVDGVEVDVPVRIDDPNAGQWVIEAGHQKLNGWEALIFARSRAYADGDFTRTSNQRLLIEALVKKAVSLPPTDLMNVVMTAAKCVETDLSVVDLFGLAKKFKDGFTMYSAMVPSTTAMIDDISYVIADTGTLDKMMKIVDQGGDPNTVENYNGSQIGSALEQ